MFSVKKFDVMTNKEINYGHGYTYNEVKMICRGYKHDATLESDDFGTFTRSYFTRKNSRYMYIVDNYEDRTTEETTEETNYSPRSYATIAEAKAAIDGMCEDLEKLEQPATPEPIATSEINARKILSICSAIIATAEKFKNVYFFSSPKNAAGRRSYEKFYSIPKTTFEYNGDTYTVEYSLTCSCNNVYAKGYYTRNGEKITLRTIKKIAAAITAAGVTII